jgi:5-methyltetrahydropteroyltriglutamate--homocysteine methyltransferase
MTARTTPPFRADMVGSLLRTKPVKEAREKLAAGKIAAADLAAIEDREIAAQVKKQQEIGLKLATDGEFRRAFWHFDFLENLDGVQGYETDGIAFKGVVTKGHGVRVQGKIGFSENHPHVAHFKYLKSVTPAGMVAKMTIPSPSMLHYRGGRKAVDPTAYLKMEDYYADLGKAYARAVKVFYDAGCRYLQLDDTSLSYFCDPEQRKMLKERGDDPDALIHVYRDIINAATAAKPADMVITTHTCRGNFKSTFIASGGYEPVADFVFNQINVDGYFMEWDDDRSGGFEPLRFLPKGKLVVLGLVTSKFGEIETKDNIKRRIEQAAKYAPLDQLCLSPQCGFASTEEGNVLHEDEQWAKLARIVEVAKEVWG